MGWHTCDFPRWHRALIVLGTLVYFFGGGSLWLALYYWRCLSGETALVGAFGFLFSVVLVKYLLIWRCQGHEPGGPRWIIGIGMRW